MFHPQVHCALGIARVARQCAGTDTESLYQLFSSVGKVRGAATSDHVKNIVATKEDCKKKSTFGTRAGSSVQMQENAKAERPDTDDRASQPDRLNRVSSRKSKKKSPEMSTNKDRIKIKNPCRTGYACEARTAQVRPRLLYDGKASI